MLIVIKEVIFLLPPPLTLERKIKSVYEITKEKLRTFSFYIEEILVLVGGGNYPVHAIWPGPHGYKKCCGTPKHFEFCLSYIVILLFFFPNSKAVTSKLMQIILRSFAASVHEEVCISLRKKGLY